MQNLQVETSLCYYQDDYVCRENIKHLRGDTYYYADWGNLAITDLTDLYEISTSNKKRKLIQFIREYSNYYPNYSNFDCIENVIADIFDMYSIDTIKDFVYDLEKFGIEVIRKFDRYISRGYSQGDAYEIFIPYQLTEIWGCTREDFEKQLPDLYTQIDHYLWDSEICGQINISFSYQIKRETFGDMVELEFDKEFEYQEFSNDSYEVDIDIDRILNYINKVTYQSLSNEDLELIRKKLENIDYNDVEY